MTDSARVAPCIERARALRRVMRQHGEDESFELFVRALCHDLRTPLGTVALELYSNKELVEELLKRQDAAADDGLNLREELASIHDNMSAAVEQGEALLVSLLQVLNEED